jgi:agmatine deiminase
MRPSGEDDPNAAALKAIARDLASLRDAAGRKLDVVAIPSPGLVPGEDGAPMPASYVNFFIGNRAVVVPVYGAPADDDALRALEPLFPGRRIAAVPARDLLAGGGAWHCITQQDPA